MAKRIKKSDTALVDSLEKCFYWASDDGKGGLSLVDALMTVADSMDNLTKALNNFYCEEHLEAVNEAVAESLKESSPKPR
jgi:hypothetical protein